MPFHLLSDYNKNKLSTARLTLPLFVFVLGLTITLLIANAFYQSEVKFRRENLKSMAREFAKIQDLMLNNSILRIQSYNEISSLVQGSSQLQRRIVKEIISNTMFQRASLYTVVPGSINDELPALNFVQRIKTDQDQLPVKISVQLQNPGIRRKIRIMLNQNLPNSLTITHSDQGDTLTLIWRSAVNRNDFIFFSSSLGMFFRESPKDPELTAVIYDADTDLALAVEQQGTSPYKFVEEPQNPGSQSPKRFLLYSQYLMSDQYGISIHWFQVAGNTPSLYVLLVGVFGLALSLLTALFLSFILDQNRRIYTLVVNRTDQLEAAMNQAQEANLAKTRFLANMSHELRTPLNLILGMIELQQLNAKDQKSHDYLKNMQTAGEHLLNLITDLLSMSKEDASEVTISKAAIKVPAFFEEIAGIVGQECRKKDLAFKLDISHDIPAVLIGDPVKIRQILLNLLRNSLKYTSKGFLSLDVRLNNRPSTGKNIYCLSFTVTDSGVGIPKNKMNLIFERFFQLESSKMMTEGGVGLGLSIVKDLVSRMNGNITVKSELGEGSSFTVDLDLEARGDDSWINKFKITEKTCASVALIGNTERNTLIESVLPASIFTLTRIDPENLVTAHATLKKCTVLIITANTEGLISTLQSNFPDKRIIVVGNETFIRTVPSLKNIYVLDDNPILPTPLFALLEFKSERRLPELVPEPPAELATTTPLRKISALVVDDDAGNRQLMKAYLDSPDFAVKFANDGAEAFELFKQERPDVVIADLRMPRMNGFELSEAISTFEKENNHSHTPFILLTADALESTSEEARKYEISLFLTKPIRRTKILQSIQKLTQA